MFKNEYCAHLFITPSRTSFMQAMNSLGLCLCKSLRSEITQVPFIPTVPEEQQFSLRTRPFFSFPLWWGFACAGPLDSCSSLKLIKTRWKWPLLAEHSATPRILRPLPHHWWYLPAFLVLTFISLEGLMRPSMMPRRLDRWDSLMLRGCDH